MADFMSQVATKAKDFDPNISVTENGAIGYRTSGKKLVDLNFMASSMRNMDDEQIWTRFLEAYNENSDLAVLWLFFCRDLRGGMGERRTFRVIFRRLCFENTALALKLLKLIPEYGRWDDMTTLLGGGIPSEIYKEVIEIIRAQIYYDVGNATHGKPFSLMAKWLPSLNTSSHETRRIAEKLRSELGYSHKDYRKLLSFLRGRLRVVEKSMSANKWDEIDYEGVPSRASMLYREAFATHDRDRYTKYLTNVKSGNAKINAGALFPYDIVHAYMNNDAWGENTKSYDETLEQQWKALPNTVPDDQRTLVVVDGSGSMGLRIGNTGVSCHDVARSLGIYFAERLGGPYKDTFITFSARPHVVYLKPELSLQSKLKILIKEDDCSNTDIERTFDLILKTAVDNHLKQSELPANILIVSDMEFDAVTYCCRNPKALFKTIADKFESAGYKLPRLVFWNVCSRTGTIPVIENDYGVALVSGFSPAIADMVMSGKLDPAEILTDKLMSERYKPVREAMGDVNG